MSEAILELFGVVSPWLLLLLIPLYFWSRVVHKSLNSKDTHPESFERTVGWLRENSFGQLYLQFLGWLLDGVSRLIGDHHKFESVCTASVQSGGIVRKIFDFNPFTTEAYGFSLTIVYIYTVLFFLLSWVVSAESLLVIWLGSLSFSVDSSVEDRWFILCSLFVCLFIALWVVRAFDWRGGYSIEILILSAIFFVLFPGLSLVLAQNINIYREVWGVGFLSLSMIFAFLGGAKSVVFGNGALFFAAIAWIVFSLLGESGLIFAVIIGAFVGAIIFGLIVKLLSFILGDYWLSHTVFLFAIGVVFLSVVPDKYILFLFLLWWFLPLVNAPLDWLSLGVTRGLLQAMRSGHHKGLGALGFAAVDLLLALVFLFLITAVLVGVTALGNAVAGKTLVDIHGILSGIKGNPASVDHWWIYFMLLSTLVPTLIHFALAGGAATLWLPRKWRLQIADGLERDVHKTFAAWAYLTFTPVVGFIVVPGLLLYFLWWLVTTHDAWLGMHLLNWAQMLADFANPQVITP